MLFQMLTGRRWPILSYAKLASSGAHKVDVDEAQIFLAGRHRLARSELLDLDVQRLDAVGDLARGHAEDAGGLGLDPAGLLQRGDDAFLFGKIRVVDVDKFRICP